MNLKQHLYSQQFILTHVGLHNYSVTKSYSRGIHVGPTFNFTINGALICFYCIDLELITDIFKSSKFLNNMLYLSSLFL